MNPAKTKRSLKSAAAEHISRLLIDAVTDCAIYMLDADGIVASWNSGAERIKGYRADEIIGESFSLFFTKEDLALHTPSRLLASARVSGRVESEGWRVRKDGSRFWAFAIIVRIDDEAGNFIGFAKITRDLTEREAAARALAESERQLRLLVRGVTDYALYMLDPNGIVASWNLGAERIKGYSTDEILGRHFSCFYTAADRLAGVPRKALETAAANGRYEAEGFHIRKDGSQFWASVVIDAIRDEDNNLVGFAKITRDITERRHAQEVVRKAQEQAALNQKMEALGQLTGGIAHDFNNLLMIVSGQTEILKRRAQSDRDVRALEAVEQAVRHGTRLTRQMLAFARSSPLTRTVVDLRDRVDSLRELLSSSASGGISFAIEIDPDVWPVLIDPGEFELALVNLAVNARDAMPNGGTMKLTVENRICEPGSPTGLAGEFVEVRLADTGTGIAPEHIPHVFEPFFTTKEIGKGTGLGLSQVYGFVRQSEGTVQVSSCPGGGTAVSMFLPRTHETPSAAGTESGAAIAHISASGTVLIVEDNKRVSEVSAALVEQLGYRVVVAETADEALAILGSRSDIVLVFSDIVMPGEMDGVALARTVRQRYPHLPILLTSGFAHVAEKAEKEFAILRKPYEISVLAHSVRDAIASAARSG